MKSKIEKLRKQDVFDYFGGVKETADFLGCWPQSCYRWPFYVPEATAYKLEVLTDGKLKAARVIRDGDSDD